MPLASETIISPSFPESFIPPESLTAPSVHHKCVIVRDRSDLIDTLCLDLLQVLDEAWQVAGRASGSEGAGNGENNHLLVGPLLAGVVGNWDATGGDIVGLWGVRDISGEVLDEIV